MSELVQLISAHWNTIARVLLNGHVYLPIMFVDEDGVTRACKLRIVSATK